MAAATSTTRSLLCTGEDHQYPIRVCFDMMLLMRVLDGLAIRFYEFPNEVLKLLQLRYLTLTHNRELPSFINKLQQLQCLILLRHHNVKFVRQPKKWYYILLGSTKLVGYSTYLPEEIWDLEELRHLRINGCNLPNPRYGAKLPKLLTLHVNARAHLNKLGIEIELHPDSASETISCLEHIGVLNKLESLKCVVVNPRLQSKLSVAPPDHLFNMPQSLKKLSLNGLGYSWKDMTAIGSLPYLKVLKLRCSAFQGLEWETEAAGRFRSLEFLLLEDIDLAHWTTEEECFPRLRDLIIRHCYKLKKIPLEIRDISTLKMIEVDDCSPSVVASAQQIKAKAENSDLQVVINSSWN